ncbi:hypothetical protein EMPS_00585 [Entomortierella parvispora]|uniref:Centromere protein M n=1 Tax=Entomortierella parvispora TaxID=205924 RepID=A0A9P3H1C7_9FUNG|nr:hypothetical protein EMPS_00585 [Entomortierella parvispora]
MDFDIPRSVATILLVGNAGIGKRRLASLILSEIHPSNKENKDSTNISGSLSSSTNSIQFRTSESLPAACSVFKSFGKDQGDTTTTTALARRDTTSKTPGPNTNASESTVALSVNRYDLILLMVSMTDKGSWDRCKQALQKLEPSWFLGRCAIVVTRVSAVSKYAFDRDEITDFLDDFYEVPRIWTNLDQDSEGALAAVQIVRLLEITGSYRPSLRNRYSSTTGTDTTTTAPVIPSTAALLSSARFYGSVTGKRNSMLQSVIRSPERYVVESTTLPEGESSPHKVVVSLE